MLDSFTPLQIGAYGTMGLASAFTLYRATAAVDFLLMLGHQRGPARRLLASLSHSFDDTLPRRAHTALEVLRQRRPAPAARFFDQLCRVDAQSRADAARERLIMELDRAAAPHRHRLARLASVVSPLGLGFTVLTLMLYLADRSVGETTGVGEGLLEALPISLGTTAIACFNLVLLKALGSLIAQRTDDTIATVLAAGDAWLARATRREVP